MTLQEPTSMDECVYFTNRSIGKGKARMWVFREKCPKCGQALMGKPRDPKTGKPKIRAKEYVCPSCHYTVEKEAYEDTLTANVQYTCPYCALQGEIQVSFNRRKVQRVDEELQKKATVDALRFTCGKCGKNIDVTKKMK